MKKVISLLLAALFLASLVPAAMAEEETAVLHLDFEAAADGSYATGEKIESVTLPASTRTALYSKEIGLEENGNSFLRLGVNVDASDTSAKYADFYINPGMIQASYPAILSFRLRHNSELEYPFNPVGAAYFFSLNPAATGRFLVMGGKNIGYASAPCITLNKDEWYMVSFVIPEPGALYGSVMDSLGNEQEFPGEATGKNMPASFNQIRIQAFVKSTGGAQQYIDIDDITMTPYKQLCAMTSAPADGADGVNIVDKITVDLDAPAADVSAARLELNGTDSGASASLVNENHTIEFTLAPGTLAADTEYQAVVTGAADIKKVAMEEYRFRFQTRPKTVTVTGVDCGVDSGTASAVVGVDNETDVSQPAAVILARFGSDGILKHAKVEAKLLESGRDTIKAELSGFEAGDGAEVLAWDQINVTDGLHPLGYYPEGAVTANSFLEYTMGVVTVSGSQAADGKVTVLALKPDADAADITETDIAYAGETVCGEDGKFTKSFPLPITEEDNGKAFQLYVGADGASPVGSDIVVWSPETVAAVFRAIQNTDAAGLVSMLRADDPVLVGEVEMNDVLGLDLIEYDTFHYPEMVCGRIAGKAYTTVTDVISAFQAAVDQQRAYETPINQAIAEINSAAWDGLEKLFQTHRTLLELDLEEFNDLSASKKQSVLKILSRQTFVTKEDLNEAIRKEVEAVSESRPQSSGPSTSSNSPSGSKYAGDITVPAEMVTPAAPQQTGETKERFSDIGHVAWAKEGIEYLASKGIVEGVKEGVFAPDAMLTREQFVKMMVLAAGKEGSGEMIFFSDTEAGSWYYPYVAAGCELGLVNGLGDGTFGVGKGISRQDLAVILARAAAALGKALPPANGEPYSDDAAIADYAKDSVYALGSSGIMNGVGDGMFSPGATVNRAMAAKAVYELLIFAG